MVLYYTLSLSPDKVLTTVIFEHMQYEVSSAACTDMSVHYCMYITSSLCNIIA